MPRNDGQILARWRASLYDVDSSPLGFFERVHERVVENGLDDIRFSEVTRREGGLFSPDRVYFRIRGGRMFFDLSAFVAGRMLVVGYWLHRDHPGLFELFSELPGIGALLGRALRPATYYRVDLMESFQHLVHNSILFVMDELSAANGIALLPEADRQPVWEEIW